MITRRGAIQAGISGAVAASLWLGSDEVLASSAGPPDIGVGPLFPTPQKALRQFRDCRYGAFLCWSPATLVGKEFSWSRNVEVPVPVYDNLYKKFDPKEFDADAWVRVVRKGGFRYAVFVTKHHDGFAMWNTKTTHYSIMNTPFGRDVLQEVAAACDKAVLEVDMPRFNRDVPWEYTTPANGRSYCWTPGPYGEPDAWIDNLVKSACGDGNYVLGLTPAASGRFDPALVDKLSDANLWLQRYGESGYATRGGPYMRTNIYGSTCRDNRVYVHIFDPKATRLTLPPLPLKIIDCRMLNGGEAACSQSTTGVTVKISPNDMESPSTIVLLELEGMAEGISPMGEAPLNRGVPVRSSTEDSSQDQSAADGDMHTRWTAHGKSAQPWLEYDLGGDRTFSRAILFEGGWEGQSANIHHYQIEAKFGAEWRLAADVTPWGFDTPRATAFDNWPISVFHPEVRFQPVTARFVRLKIVRATAVPVIHEFQLFER